MVSNNAADPESLIFDLDESLGEVGESVTLRRTFGTELMPIDVVCRTVLRGYQPQELVGEITQQDQNFILSPTEINNARWPGYFSTQSIGVDARIPRKNDVIISTRGNLSVQAAAGIYINNVLVRIEGRVRGS